MRTRLTAWPVPAWGAWIFGSAARGDGGVTSDIDVLIVREDDLDEGETDWLAQLGQFADEVTAWTGNSCEIVEYGSNDFEELMARDDRLGVDLRSDGVALTSRQLPRRSAGAPTLR